MKIGELFVQLGVKADTKELTAFNQKIKETVGNLELLQKKLGSDLSNSEKSDETKEEKKSGFLGRFLKGASKIAPIIASLIYVGRAITQVIQKLAKLVLGLTQVSYETLKLARNFGVSTSAMQKFGYEAVASGVKLNDFQSAVARLKQNSADILLGRGDISPYALLGINPHEDPEQVLIHLQQRLKQLPEAIGTAFASDLGLSPDMINYVRKADFSKIASRPSLSRSDLKYLDDLRGSALETLNLFSLLGQKILSVFAPLLNSIFKPINNMLSGWVMNLGRLRDMLLAISMVITGIVGLSNPFLGGLMLLLTGLGLIIEDLVVHKGEGIKLWIENLGIMFKNIGESIMGFIDSIIEKIKSVSSSVGGGIGKFFGLIDSMFTRFQPKYQPDLSTLDSRGWRNTKVDVDINLKGDVKLKDTNGTEVGTIDSKNIDLSKAGINSSNLSTAGVTQ